MKNDKLEDASTAAANIRRDRSAPKTGGVAGEPYTDSQVYVPLPGAPDGGWAIPPTPELSGERPTTLDDTIAAQHRNFNASPYGGVHPASMDAVNRDDFPDAAELDAVFMGNETMTPGSGAANVSTYSKASRRPSKIPSGSASTAGNRIDLP